MSGRDDGSDEAARLVQRVLADPEFRQRLRRDPNLQPALETLELRESKSSLAGALAAAAVEGLALFELAGDGGGLGAEAAEAAVRPPADGVDALLDNPNVQLDAAGVADVRAGRIDPRIVAVLEDVSRSHRITVSAMLSDHGVRTVGGSISNHHYGRAVDIAAIDGRPVAPGNAAARRLAESLLRLEPSVRPTELGSPWALGDPVAFTDADHQNHIHVAYDDPPPPGWTPLDSALGTDDAAVADLDDSDDSDDDDEDDEDEDDDEDEEDDEDDDGEDEDGDEDDEDDEDDDEDEPDEDEPDEDEVGPDFDDLTDDEYQGNAVALYPPADAPSSSPTPDDVDLDLDGAPTEYPGDDAPRERIAAWMAREAERRGLPPELPVMAALVESGMHNLPGGDADSVGFFQMRSSIWDQGEYAGYATSADLQLKWFLDHAVRLPARAPEHYGDWIADVERPAERYRGRYQLQLDEARELLRGFRANRAPSANDARVLPVIRPDQVTRRAR